MQPPYLLRLPLPVALLPPACRAAALQLAPLAASVSADGEGSSGGELTSRRRRQLRQERRESRAGEPNWREEIEDRLSRRRKKEPRPKWTEELNINLLASLGPQWWVLRVSRAANAGAETASRVAALLARHFPDLQFKIYYPSVHERKKLKNGTVTTKSTPLYPGCVFLYCVLNKEIHDFIKECTGVGGFLGSRVGNVIRQIMKPKPLPIEQIEAIFKQAKEEQERVDREFEENEKVAELSSGEGNLTITNRVKGRTKKAAGGKRKDGKSLAPGAIVHVLSGPFSEFTGCVEEVDQKNRKARVGLTLFGKESFVDLDIDQIDIVNV